MPRAKPLSWRVQSNDEGGFDELVVRGRARGECLIHAEMMNDRAIFVSVGDYMIWAHVNKQGKVVVTHKERARPPSQQRGKDR